MIMHLEQGVNGPVDATANPSYLASLKSRMVPPFWCQLSQVVQEKRPLKNLVVVVVVVYDSMCVSQHHHLRILLEQVLMPACP